MRRSMAVIITANSQSNPISTVTNWVDSVARFRQQTNKSNSNDWHFSGLCFGFVYIVTNRVCTLYQIRSRIRLYDARKRTRIPCPVQVRKRTYGQIKSDFNCNKLSWFGGAFSSTNKQIQFEWLTLQWSLFWLCIHRNKSDVYIVSNPFRIQFIR